MSETAPIDRGTLPPEQALRLEAVCDRFERAWQASGPPPRVEDFLIGWEGPARQALLRELVQLELYYRRGRGDAPAPAEYQSRFPDLDPAWLTASISGPGQAPAEGAAGDTGAFASAAVEEQPAVENSGRSVGPYKLLQKLGEGGMGAVWMAEQEQPVRRKVALKLVKAGLDSAQVLARFEAERQALALMDHPNIAKVLDAGTTEEGRPFFVMELVKGVPITKFCDEQQLTPRQRLELFVPVCQAVQHAHQKGVIHRDLKPSNVLVALYDDRPVPKVIDFGVAKAAGERLTERTMFTEFGAIVGTLEYMSPEQARLNALDIDTRADVYALGVILYELLTGTTPFERKRLRQAALDELLRIIREEEPPRPSTRLRDSQEFLPSIAAVRGTEPAKLTRLMRGELDWIVMKCLEKDRSRRYESAGAFAADVQRYLHGDPVQACPPSALYRFRKFARRHRVAMAMVAISSVASVLLVAVLLVSNLMITQALADRTGALNDLREHEAKTRAALQDRTSALNELKSTLAREQRASYSWAFLLALGEWRAGRLARSDRILDDCQPPELRGWEWHYLKRLCNDPGLLNLPGHLGRGFLNNQEGYGQPLPLSRDGGRMALAVTDTVTVFDASTARAIREFRCDRRTVACVALSPDGQLVAVAGKGQDANGEAWSQLELWEIDTGRRRFLSPKIPCDFNCLAFRPGGEQLAAAGGVWTFNRRPNGTVQASSLEGGVIRLVDARAGRELHTFQTGRGAGVFAALFSPDGRTLAAPYGAEVRRWDLASAQELAALKGLTKAATGLAFSPDGRSLAAASLDGTVRIWALPAAGEGRIFFGHPEGILSVAFSADGQRLAGGGSNGEIRVWDTTTGREAAVIRNAWGVGAVAFSPDGQRLFAVNAKGLRNGEAPAECKVWEIAAGQEVHLLDGHTRQNYGGQGSWSVAFSPDSQLLASGGDRTVKVWDPGQRRLVRTLQGHTDDVFGIAFSPDGKQIASASSDRTVRIWDARTGRNVLTLKGHTADVWNVAFHPTGDRVASTSEDGTVKVWDARTGQEIRTLQRDIPKQAKYRFATVAFSPDGRLLVGVGDDDLVWIWNADTGEKLVTLEGHENSVWHATFSKDGRLLATASIDRTVRIWDVGTRQVSRILEGTWTFGSAAFSPDGQRLATTGGAYNDGSVKLWDLTTGRELLPLRGGTHIVTFSPNGHYLAAAGADGKVRLWDARPVVPDRPVARDYNDQAWLLATRPEAQRDPGQAVELAQKAVDLAPREGVYWNTVGVAQYRAGDWQSAIQALTRSMDLLRGQLESFNTFFLAMAHWQLGEKELARQWYDQAVQWAEEHREALAEDRQHAEELRRFRAEAAALLRVNGASDPDPR